MLINWHKLGRFGGMLPQEIFIPSACARGKVIGSVVAVVVVINQKIARSRHLGTLVTCEHMSVKFGEKTGLIVL